MKLSTTEEAELGKRALTGDRIARQQLFDSMVGLAYKLASRPGWQREGIERDDLRQEAAAALWVCTERFDPIAHPGIRFSTFAGYCVVMHLRTYCSRNRRRELTNFRMDDFPDPSTLAAGLDERDAEAILRSIKRLPSAERELMELHYGLLDGNPLTFAAIGARFNISKQAVHQKVTGCINRIADGLRKSA